MLPLNAMKTEIDTPRTDAAIPHWSTLPHQNGWVPVDFARQLERELNEAKKDSKLLDWLEHIMAPGKNYVEVYLAGLRNGNSDAVAYQFEANSPDPRWGLAHGKTLREAIDKANDIYENQQKTVLQAASEPPVTRKKRYDPANQRRTHEGD